MRVRVLALMLVPLLPLAAAAQVKPPFQAERAGWAAACNTYENRARFMTREGEVPFAVVVAEACLGALASLDSGRPAERDAAARLLTRVAVLRDTIVQMNIERVYGTHATPRAMPEPRSGTAWRIAGVSATGEYLIARHLGVVDAIRAWLDTGAHFSLASR